MIIHDKTIDIIPAQDPSSPLVILNAYTRESDEIYRLCREQGCPDFTLVGISGLSWDDELSPWSADPIVEGDMPFGGKADIYLDQLLNDILPAVKAQLGAEPRTIMCAGYSLAGLFALYAGVRCDVFGAAASCSGSMWFPGFKEYILSADPAKLPKAVYLSLGDREARTRNAVLRTVETNTSEIAGFLSESGVRTVFELNKGNHFQQGALRTAKGIKWILENI